MQDIYKKLVFAIVGGLLAVSGFLVSTLQPVPKTLRGATPGLSATLVGTSTVDVGGGVRNLFNARLNCTSRVISTASSTLMIGFGSTTPSEFLGLWQGASTTVAYDSEIFGCGQWRVYGFASGTVITTLEFN